LSPDGIQVVTERWFECDRPTTLGVDGLEEHLDSVALEAIDMASPAEFPVAHLHVATVVEEHEGRSDVAKLVIAPPLEVRQVVAGLRIDLAEGDVTGEVEVECPPSSSQWPSSAHKFILSVDKRTGVGS